MSSAIDGFQSLSETRIPRIICGWPFRPRASSAHSSFFANSRHEFRRWTILRAMSRLRRGSKADRDTGGTRDSNRICIVNLQPVAPALFHSKTVKTRRETSVSTVDARRLPPFSIFQIWLSTFERKSKEDTLISRNLLSRVSSFNGSLRTNERAFHCLSVHLLICISWRLRSSDTRNNEWKKMKERSVCFYELLRASTRLECRCWRIENEQGKGRVVRFSWL